MLLDVLSFDVVVEICEYLSSRDQGQMAKASRLVLLIATQAGRRATLAVGASLPSLARRASRSQADFELRCAWHGAAHHR